MKKIASFLFLFIFVGFDSVTAATMNDYCISPPFTSTSVKPNVLINMDFSGSMQFPAYLPCNFDGYNNYVALCRSSSLPDYKYDSTKDYYGYFDNTKYYKYASNRFQVNTACTDTNRIGSSNCISGNLLNWITSTRIDITRKVLTGGRSNAGKLESEGATYDYTDSTLKCKFTITATTTANRKLTVQNSSGTCPIGTLSNATINLDDPGATGIVQEFWDKVHFEFMVYSSGSGSYARYGEMRSDKDATQSSLISAINNETPFYGTPTGEAMWEAYDFFKQSNANNYEANSSSINPTNGNKDPWYDGSGGSATAIPCRKAFVLLLSDGAWNGSVDPVKPARTMIVNDLRTASALTGKQNVRTYAVYAFGETEADGRQSMITTAIFGGFDDNDSNTWPYPFTDYPSNSKDVTYPRSECNYPTRWDSQCSEWDKDKNNLPDNFFEADDGDALRTAIFNALMDMLRRATSGTAVSVLASGEGSGANMLQAVFYPKRAFGTTEIDWTGEMQNLWYYIDPFLQSSTIREDTDSNKILKLLTGDRVVSFFFDTSENKTKARFYNDTDGDGDADGSYVDIVPIEDLKNLWEAGTLLWSRTSARTIKTTIGSSLIDFSTANESILRSYLQAADATEGTKIINYIHGIDQTGYRNRTVAIDLNKDGDTMDTGESAKVWKLGDIISSTPRLQSSIKLNTYHLLPPQGYGDTSYQTYINSDNYKNRGMVYVGANDGMLHAFKLGKLEFKWTGQAAYEKARLTGTDLGKEEWAFIPKNALPYLKYLTDPNYCHLYYIDAPSYIFDASINVPTGCTGNYWNCDKQTTVDTNNNLVVSDTSWRTILIGGMGLGGACRNYNATCAECVKTPIDGVGYSSYFALDVTDPANPTLLWEFSSDQLGFSTSGPAIVRMGPGNKNGRWFAVFASGPTGEINTSSDEFLGKSDQNLKLFVIDLKTGTLVRTIDTGIANAFGGSMFNASADTDRWNAASEGVYSDDVFYVGYVKKSGSTWTDGGVLRVITKDKDSGDADTDIDGIDPANWSVSTVIDGIGPVTTAVAKLQDRKTGTLWLYFGTGRFFYKTDDPGSSSDKEKIFGIKEPCYTTANDMDNACTSSVSFASLSDRTDTGATGVPTYGWYISLDAPTGSYNAERVITDPLAAFSGAVFFTTFAPTSDVCGFGGNTYLWAVRYDTGYEAISLLQGKAMIQVSTGEIKELTLPSVLAEKASRRTAAITGMPPKGQGLSVVINPKPIKRIMHIQEK